MALIEWALWRWQWLLDVDPTLRRVRRARRQAAAGEDTLLRAILVELSRARRAVGAAATVRQDAEALAGHLHVAPPVAQALALRLRGASWATVRWVAGDVGGAAVSEALRRLRLELGGASSPGWTQAAFAAEGRRPYGSGRAGTFRSAHTVRCPPAVYPVRTAAARPTGGPVEAP